MEAGELHFSSWWCCQKAGWRREVAGRGVTLSDLWDARRLSAEPAGTCWAGQSLSCRRGGQGREAH